ncbi:potassium/hydrogen exchange-like protein [Ceratobasidium sp. AG-Ba]|nr:potassium/hydrogen exchange-like protein [Ceratobasidium sp. AG-Ba]
MAKPPSSMRLIALPLTSSANHLVRRSGNRHPLIYYHVQMPESKAHATEAEKPSLFKRGQDKVAQMWIDWGKASGGWKLKVHTYGEKLIDRIDFEELALASTDTSLGPKMSKLSAHESEGKRLSEKQSETHSVSIPLIYPPAYMSSVDPLIHLRALLVHRSPLHRSRTWLWMGLAPFTAPFMLLPVVPNLPFFFCVWRGWTHWKAHKASAYLLELIENDAVQNTPSKELDVIYSESAPRPPPGKPATPKTSNSPDADPAVTQLIPKPTVTIPRILKAYDLPKEAERSFFRAVEQARLRSEADGDLEED